ncbi:MAG: SRPBCC family protein [Bradyrhizobium sp.]
MSNSFERRHDILIEAPPEAVYDYVCNPNSWPEWLAASHRIDSADRALGTGETFREQWHIRRGEVVLDWKVLESDRPNAWTVQADTDFIGPIVVRYTFERVGDATRYTRHLRNPRRPTAASAEQIQRVDEEAQVGLGNIKRQVEQRWAARRAPQSAGKRA